MAGMHVGGPVLVGDPVLDPTPVESGGIPEWATVESGYPGTYQPPVAPQVELLVGEAWSPSGRWPTAMSPP
ncbi:hypothetical protein ACTD5D_03950 [Nocardia takedensis]|uniref:hypothetical protein n=1 Tax=Nocardia takedensis TaxID=259390 RepID=UPI003F76349A